MSSINFLKLNSSKVLFAALVLAVVLSLTSAFASAQEGGRSEYARSGYMSYLKDQCKDDGWKTQGFDNQGQCVSFFAQGE